MTETKGGSHTNLLSEVASLAGEIGYTVEICDTGRAGAAQRRALRHGRDGRPQPLRKAHPGQSAR